MWRCSNGNPQDRHDRFCGSGRAKRLTDRGFPLMLDASPASGGLSGRMLPSGRHPALHLEWRAFVQCNSGAVPLRRIGVQAVCRGRCASPLTRPLSMTQPAISHYFVESPSRRALVIGAIGVVFGDIGTSPLYALKECFSSEHGIPFSDAAVMGIISMLFCAMIIVVSLKYVMFVMRADNDGEGGILALMALALRTAAPRSRMAKLLMMFGIFGACMFYGDAVITPAISVLSAVE